MSNRICRAFLRGRVNMNEKELDHTDISRFLDCDARTVHEFLDGRKLLANHWGFDVTFRRKGIDGLVMEIDAHYRQVPRGTYEFHIPQNAQGKYIWHRLQEALGHYGVIQGLHEPLLPNEPETDASYSM